MTSVGMFVCQKREGERKGEREGRKERQTNQMATYLP